jgi:hypothetical protein
MSHSPSFGDCGVALCQCLIRMTEAEQDNPQDRLCYHLRVDSDLMDKRAVRGGIIKGKRFFQMRLG